MREAVFFTICVISACGALKGGGISGRLRFEGRLRRPRRRQPVLQL